MQLNSFSKVPLYFQIQKAIEERIYEEWSIDEKIPSESDLMEEFQVSRNTVKKAIEELVNLGLLYRIQGKGTFVSKKQVKQSLSNLYSFSESFEARGLQLKNKLLSVKKVTATDDVKKALNLAGNEVIELTRLRCIDDAPTILETSYFNTEYVNEIEPFFDISNKSMYQVLSEYFGINISSAEESFEAVNLQKKQSSILLVEKGDAALYLERIAYDSNGQAMEFCKSFVRKGNFKFTINLT